MRELKTMLLGDEIVAQPRGYASRSRHKLGHVQTSNEFRS